MADICHSPKFIGQAKRDPLICHSYTDVHLQFPNSVASAERKIHMLTATLRMHITNPAISAWLHGL